MSLVIHHNGVLKLPPGFRFHPTDEELVVQYLKRKVCNCPLPVSIIPDVDLAKLNPWDLPGGWEQERYFFALREAKYPRGKRSNRATGCGYWKVTGKDKAITASNSGRAVGTKKTLVFYGGKERTDWIMHEYSLAMPETRSCVFPQRKNTSHSIVAPAKDWVLCRIFMKKRAAMMDVEMEKHQEDRRASGCFDFVLRQSSPASDSSSCVTEAANESSNGEDITSPP